MDEQVSSQRANVQSVAEEALAVTVALADVTDRKSVV